MFFKNTNTKRIAKGAWRETLGGPKVFVVQLLVELIWGCCAFEKAYDQAKCLPELNCVNYMDFYARGAFLLRVLYRSYALAAIFIGTISTTL